MAHSYPSGRLSCIVPLIPVNVLAQVYVEVVDVETAVAPLQGFGGRALPPITGDHPRGVRVAWEGRATPPTGEKAVRLKFYCRQARLYSFWLAQD